MRARLILAFTSFLDGLCARGVVVFLSFSSSSRDALEIFGFGLPVVLSLLLLSS
jgi:hypothetical protein